MEWLAWLARGMQQHGQTVFLIEQLQPSWLPMRGQRRIYTLSSRLLGGLYFGLIFGLSGALWYGGLDVIQHYTLRFILHRKGYLPWKLAPFLDYAAEDLTFLRKVGGGYLFIHRYLLEHFAAMGEASKTPETPVQSTEA